MQIPIEFKRLFDRDWREAGVYGGRFSLKSHTVARLLIIRARMEKTRVACFREFQNSIADSSHQLLADLINKYELTDFEITDNSITNKLSGSDFIFKGLHRNEQSIKSIEGVDVAWCFVAGTQIDGKNIEDIKIGDFVRSYNHKTQKIEYQKVLKTFKRKAPDVLVKILTSRGALSIITTKEHPIYIKGKGYIKAENVKAGDIIFYEKNTNTRKISLFRKLWGIDRNKHKRSQTKSIEEWRALLLGLCKKKNVRKNETSKPYDDKRNQGEYEKNSKRYKSQAKNFRGQWKRLHDSTKFIIRKTWKGLVERISSANKSGEKFYLPNKLQNRFSKHLLYVSDRMRWFCSSWENFKRRRSKENRIFEELRVDSIEVQKQRDLKQYGLSDEGNYVYNIEVEVNNNYFANGVLVHNCEEAQTLSQSSLEILTPTIRKEGSQIIYTYNRLFEEDPVHKRLVLEGRPNTLILNVNYDVALKYGFMPESVRLEMEDDKERRPQLYKHKWLGEPNALESKIYKDWVMVDSIPHEAKLIRYGLDFGYTQDPTAIVAIYYFNGGYILDEIAYQKGLSNKSIADILMQQESVLCIADSAEPKSIDEIKSYGVLMLPASKGPGSVNQGIQFVREQKISITKRSMNLWREYQNYLYISDKNGKITNEPQGYNDHMMSATRYGFNNLKPPETTKTQIPQNNFNQWTIS